MTTEEWRPVPGWAGYEASSLGRIRSTKRGAARVLTPNVNRYGYLRLQVRVARGEIAEIRVHRMVLAAFAGPCPDGMQACHNNGVKTDNRISNLRWDTPKENQADVRRHGNKPVGTRSPNAKMTEEQVKKAIEVAGAVPAAKLAAEFGVSRKAVRLAQTGRSWAHVHASLADCPALPKARVPVWNERGGR